jgi:acetyl esterase/lipase
MEGKRMPSRREFLSILSACAVAPRAFAQGSAAGEGRAGSGGSANAGANGSAKAGASAGATYPVEMKTVAYSSPGGKDLLADLYLPQGLRKPAPVIVSVHGGGWLRGSRVDAGLKQHFAERGFAMASIDYRLTPSIQFPSNVEDVKTAVRWVRANAKTYGFDAGKVGLWGSSAGGQLVAVAALSPKGMFEGEGNLDQSSAVQCVLDGYGPSNLLLLDQQTEQEKATLQPRNPELAGINFPAAGDVPHGDAKSPESILVGAPIQTAPEKVKAASPVTYVHRGAPPFLLMHGLADNAVPHHQSILLYESLAAAGDDVTLCLIDGLPHGFFSHHDLDERGGPFRMEVRTHPAGKAGATAIEQKNVFDVAGQFFRKWLG